MNKIGNSCRFFKDLQTFSYLRRYIFEEHISFLLYCFESFGRLACLPFLFDVFFENVFYDFTIDFIDDDEILLNVDVGNFAVFLDMVQSFANGGLVYLKLVPGDCGEGVSCSIEFQVVYL